jgi:hypothetical protein
MYTKMKRTDLETNRIFILDITALKGGLPRYIERLRKILLDFAWTVVDGVDDDDELRRMDENLLNDSSLHSVDRKVVKDYRRIRDEARHLHIGQDKEAEWQLFFRDHFFHPLALAARMRDEDTRQ